MNSQAAHLEARSDKSLPAWFRFVVPSVADLIFIVLLISMTGGVLASRLLGDASIGWHIRNGELMLQSHAITRTDPFSVTMAGQPWYAWEWLYDLAVAGIHHHSGLNGVVFVTALIISATFALTLRIRLRRGADLLITIALLALALGASMIHLFARPHVVSWLFTVIWFQLLDSSESSESPNPGRRLWLLPVLMLFWVNLHGGFVVGFVLLGIYLADGLLRFFRQPELRSSISRRLRQLGAVTAASLLASLANPHGYRLHVHVYRYLSSRWLMNHIDEFLSPNFHGIAQQCFVLILLVAIAAMALGKRPRFVHVLVLLFATYSGLYASRSLPVSSLLITLIIAPLLTRAVVEGSSNTSLAPGLRRLLARWQAFGSRMASMELNFRGRAWPVLAVIVGLWVCLHQGRVGNNQWMDAHFDAGRFPVQATDFLAQRGIREPIFAPDSWGGYLIYRLYPGNKVFVDDRHDFYGEEFLKDYLKAIRLTPDWDTFINARRVNWVLVPARSSLANMLKQTSQWTMTYHDNTAELFERKPKQ